MPFSESVKTEVRKQAQFRCCLCHSLGIEVHHVLPESEGGADDIDNAAPLCPSCHEIYGANPTKRKFIIEARAVWYDICRRQYESESGRLEELQNAIRELVTKDDLESAIQQIAERLQSDTDDEPLPDSIGNLPISADSFHAYLRWMFPDLTHCGQPRCEQVAADLISIGYSDIASLHEFLGHVRRPVATVSRERRDAGDNMDEHADVFGVVLFLALLDERYCLLRYPKVHANRPADYRWMRPVPAR